MEIWAKSNGLPLKKHTTDVLNAIDNLPFDKLDYNKLKIDKEYIKNLLQHAGFFHDLGKISPTFQKKIGNLTLPSEILNFPDIRHNILSLFFINKEKVKEVCKNKEGLYTSFLSAIAFHHWKQDEKKYFLQIDNNLIRTAELLLKNNNGTNLAEMLKQHFRNFQVNGNNVNDYIQFDENLAIHIFKKGDLISANILPPYTLYFLPEKLKAEIELKINLNLWIFLSGFLMRADHFASFVESQEHTTITLSEIEKCITNLSLENKLEKNFGDAFWQKELVKNLKNNNIIFIAPTGIGKTEFAFLWAENEKFFYTLPFRAATNQIFKRACSYFNTADNTDDPFISGNVGLLHSDADLYILGKSEVSKMDVDGEIPRILDLSQHFSLPVNICTGDQIFPASLKYPQYEKVYATMGYSKLVIDEVQAYDPKACAIVLKMIEDIVSLGGKFLLMTATLPKFVENYLKERGIINNENIIDYYSNINSTIVRHKIEIRNKGVIGDINEIINKAVENKRVLIVCNTINKAEDVYKKIKKQIGNTQIFLELLHSRFTLEERKKKEEILETEFKNPKPKDERIPKIIVATQVIEASLDIDADYLFTEIAPVDSLIQRMGRVMRRVNILSGKIKGTEENFVYGNYYANSENNIYIYHIGEKGNMESGKGNVYENKLLEKTYEILKSGEVPENNKQKLVEELYSEQHLTNSEYLKSFYNTISILNSGYVSEHRESAHKLFRAIYTLPVIEENRTDEVVASINRELSTNMDITWFWFKKEIVAKYVINYPEWKTKKLAGDTLWKKLVKNKIICEDKKILDKLKRYSECIWIINEKYSSEETFL